MPDTMTHSFIMRVPVTRKTDSPNIMTPRSPILSRQLAVGEVSEVGSAQPLSSSRGDGANSSIKTSPVTGDEVSGHVASSSKPAPQLDGVSDAKIEDMAQVNGCLKLN